MAAKKTAKKAVPVDGLAAEVDAIIRLIDHAKKSGLAHFEGPGGLKFAFHRPIVPRAGLTLPKEQGDGFIP